MLVRASAKALPMRDESVDCIVTSPPYNVGIKYSEYKDDIPWNEYWVLALRSMEEMQRVLIPGGRAWINVMPTVPCQRLARRVDLGHIWQDAARAVGFHYRDTIAWVQDSHDGKCAWGSWRSPTAPNLRGSWELILQLFKPPYHRSRPADAEPLQPKDDLGGTWSDLVRNVWHLRPVRRSDGAPAPYPIELPARCIRLSTWPGELVLDPFVGSGTTLNAADQLGRRSIGFDLGAV